MASLLLDTTNTAPGLDARPPSPPPTTSAGGFIGDAVTLHSPLSRNAPAPTSPPLLEKYRTRHGSHIVVAACPHRRRLEPTALLFFLLARAAAVGFATERDHTPLLELRWPNVCGRHHERRCCRDEMCHQWRQASRCSTIPFCNHHAATLLRSRDHKRPYSRSELRIAGGLLLLICIGLLWCIWVRDSDDDECDSGLLLVSKWWCDVEMVALRKGYAVGVRMLRWWRWKCAKGLKWCQRMKTCRIKLDLCVRACWVWYMFFFILVFYVGECENDDGGVLC